MSFPSYPFLANRSSLNSVLISGVYSSRLYRDVVDMCNDTDRISLTSYFTSPGFPAGFRGIGSCMCTVKPVNNEWFMASVKVEHIMLSDLNVCNEEFDISIINNEQEKNVHECSPSLIEPWMDTFEAREIRVSFRRAIATGASTGKTVVWVGIRGMFTDFVMMTSSHVNTFPITGHLREESYDYWRVPSTKGQKWGTLIS